MKGKGKNPQLNHCKNSKLNVTKTRVGEVAKKKEGDGSLLLPRFFRVRPKPRGVDR